MKEEVLAEFELIKTEGGEIPEVYFWNSYFWLTERPPSGLGLKLNSEELKYLKRAVLERYLFIIKRDLSYENIGTPAYRGIERALVNIKRLKKFLKENFKENKWNLVKIKIKKWVNQFKKDLEKNGYKNWLKSDAFKNLENTLKEDL